MAYELMEEHLDPSWRFGWDNAVRRVGCTNFSRKMITLSRPLTETISEDVARDTILHEIAHALAGHAAGHGPVWQAQALAIGANGRRTVAVGQLVAPEPKYVGTCPNCGPDEEGEPASAVGVRPVL